MANETIMQGLLESLLQRPQQQDQGAVLANMISQPNATAALTAYMMPQRMANVGQAARGMFGLPEQVTPESLIARNPQALNTPAGLLDMARMLQQSGDTNGAAKFAIAAQQKAQSDAALKLEQEQSVAQTNLAIAQTGDIRSRKFLEEQQLALEAKKVEQQRLMDQLEGQRLTADISRINNSLKTQEEKAAELNYTLAQTARLNAEALSMPDDLNIRLRSIAAQEGRLLLDRQTEERVASQLSAIDRKEIYAATSLARQQQQSAFSIMSLATRFKANPPLAGVPGAVTKYVTDFLGQQGDTETIRQDFNKIVNSGVLQGLPKGAASDRDIEVASRGFPSSFTGADNALAFMEGATKLAALTAEMENARAAYIQKNRSDVGFMEEWQAKVNSPEFIEQINNKYQIRIGNTIQASDADIRATVPR